MYRIALPTRHEQTGITCPDDLVYEPPQDESKKIDSAHDPELYAYKSPENCRRACKDIMECYQWLWDKRS